MKGCCDGAAALSPKKASTPPPPQEGCSVFGNITETEKSCSDLTKRSGLQSQSLTTKDENATDEYLHSTDLSQATPSLGSLTSYHSARNEFFGRSEELSLLNESFDTVIGRKNRRNRTFEVALIHAQSGAGKTALVHQFRDGIMVSETHKAFFVEGSFNQNSGAPGERPYSAIGDAITQLCNVIYSKSDLLQQIRDSIEEELQLETKSAMSELSKIVPALNMIIDHEATISLGASETTDKGAFKRLMHSFRCFLKLVCDIHPVVLFLDDLQWCEQESQQLITLLILDESLKNFLLIGATRNGISSLSEWEEITFHNSTVSTTTIELGPLDIASINMLVCSLAGILHDAQAMELSEVVNRKTGGIAYFVREYVGHLLENGFISLNFQTNRTIWDLERIESETDISRNVVATLAKQFMSADVKCILMLASCLGFYFDETALVSVVDSVGCDMEQLLFQEPAAERTAADLSTTKNKYKSAIQQALKKGLIEQMNDGRMKFAHSTVQEASLNLFPQGGDGNKIKARIGRSLIDTSRTVTTDENDMLLNGVDILTRSFDRESSEEAKLEVAGLCLEAGREAERNSSFIPATYFLKEGIGLLNKTTRWTEHYDLCLELHVKAAEVGRTHGDYNSTLELIEEITLNARSLEDSLSSISVKAYVLASQKRLPDAIKTCRDTLKRLSVKMPTKPTMLTVIVEYARTTRLLRKREPAELLKLPRMLNKETIHAVHFLNAAALFAWHGDLEILASWIYLRMTRLTLKEGLCKHSPFAFATYGILVATLGRVKQGYKFGKMAKELHTLLEDSNDCIASTVMAVESCLTHLQVPLYDSLASLLDAHRIGMRTGEIEYAALCICGHGGVSIVLGATLDGLEQTLSNYVAFYRDYGQGMCWGLTAPWLQFVRSLQNKTENPLVLKDDGFDESDFIRKAIDASHLIALRNIHLTKLCLLYLFGDIEGANESRLIWEQGSAADGVHFFTYYSVLFSGLTCVGMAQKHPKKRRRYLRIVRKYEKRMEKLVSSGGMNAVLIQKLLAAERLSLENDATSTKTAFAEAISIAGRTGSRLLHALACERVGQHMLSIPDLSSASQYLQQARVQFAEYGAVAKVIEIENRFNLLNYDRPLRGLVVQKSSTSFQLLPKSAEREHYDGLNGSGLNSISRRRSSRSNTSFRSSGSRFSLLSAEDSSAHLKP